MDAMDLEFRRIDDAAEAAMGAASLEELRERVAAYGEERRTAQTAAREHDPLDMTSLPTYGGDEPADTHGVFSWDAERLLVQRASGWAIVPRSEQ